MIVSSLCQHHLPNFYYEFGYWANEPFLYPFPQNILKTCLDIRFSVTVQQCCANNLNCYKQLK